MVSKSVAPNSQDSKREKMKNVGVKTANHSLKFFQTRVGKFMSTKKYHTSTVVTIHGLPRNHRLKAQLRRSKQPLNHPGYHQHQSCVVGQPRPPHSRSCVNIFNSLLPGDILKNFENINLTMIGVRLTFGSCPLGSVKQ